MTFQAAIDDVEIVTHLISVVIICVWFESLRLKGDFLPFLVLAFTLTRDLHNNWVGVLTTNK